ncbi:DUF3168 domain-containing protein [uncultured Sphaerochaeta sp.]|uniref:tail completion protein gp17 n=1 Tax=uncultured Sphaerochaeta sp. TaxID=886478 RepID=UPI002A0A5FB7|nr:DUF3168 domain-containing protein [uncultured Sphaerochaeta sp.]
MQYAQDYLEHLKANPDMTARFGTRIFYGLAPETATNPFAVLQDISPNAQREISTAKPRMQLDVFAADQYSASDIAEEIVLALIFTSFTSGETYFQSVTAERTKALRVEDGTWKVPIDIRFSCRRK